MSHDNIWTSRERILNYTTDQEQGAITQNSTFLFRRNGFNAKLTTPPPSHSNCSYVPKLYQIPFAKHLAYPICLSDCITRDVYYYVIIIMILWQSHKDGREQGCNYTLYPMKAEITMNLQSLTKTVHVCIPTPTPPSGKQPGISVHAPWPSLHLIALSDCLSALHRVWSGTGSVFCCPPGIYISIQWFISSTQWCSTVTEIHTNCSVRDVFGLLISKMWKLLSRGKI